MAAPPTRPNADVAALCLLLLTSLVFGGGGSPGEMDELIVQIVTLVILGTLIFVTRSTGHLPHTAVKRDWLIGGLAIAFVLLYLLQLVPLPPSLWRLLPGREALVANLEMFDAPPWLPLSIAPHLTFASLLSLIPPVAAYALAATSGRDAGRWVVRTLAFFAVLTIVLQLLQRTGNFLLYDQTPSAFTYGFQASPNAQGDILAILMTFLAFRRREESSRRVFALQQLSAAAVLLIAVILTGSRAGVMMTGAVAIILGYRLLCENGIARLRHMPMAIALGLAVVTLAAWLALQNTAIMRTIDRFGEGSQGRADIIWPDAIYTMYQFFPFGAGFGTFVPAFQIFESQETFTARFANRAHSEPLEILIEAGVVGAVLVIAFLVATLWRAFSEARKGERREERSRGWVLCTVTLLLLAHSMVDYPMRSMSIAVIFATLIGLVVADRRRRLGSASRSSQGAEAAPQ